MNVKTLLSALLLCVSVTMANGQETDPLAAVLPNGKVVHFQTPEQKAKFEAARQRQAVTTATPQPAATAPPATKFTNSMDAPSGHGVVNSAAPPFTASYYLLDPESWVGKKITLAVAYVKANDEQVRPDGRVQMIAATWNSSATTAGDQDSGGSIIVLAKPKVASQLVQQCGNTMQYLGWGHYKVTMIHGEIGKLENVRGEDGRPKTYGFFAD